MINTQNKLSYVLITSAHNEERFIEKTIQSVISQTVLPKKWIIVSDGSVDQTDEIVKRYIINHIWIELIRMPEHINRQFAAKACCFNTGYQKIRYMQYDIIGNLDADISFENDYFEFLLGKFSQMKDLGVAGTPFVENNYSTMTDSFEGEKHVAGGCQLFRRECFEEIGGYQPVEGGGVDWIAVTTARMKGWETISFCEKHFFHYRKLGTGNATSLRSTFHYGKKDYFLGGHPLYESVRVMYRMTRRPYIIGGIGLLAGYLWALFSRMERPVSQELMKFHRGEQKQKLKSILGKLLRFKKIKKYHLYLLMMILS